MLNMNTLSSLMCGRDSLAQDLAQAFVLGLRRGFSPGHCPRACRRPRVQAKFEQKGDFVAKKKAAKKKKVKKVLEKQEERELGWGGFDDVAPPTRTTVVLKAAFHPEDFAEDMALREDLETDITDECEKMGARWHHASMAPTVSCTFCNHSHRSI